MRNHWAVATLIPSSPLFARCKQAERASVTERDQSLHAAIQEQSSQPDCWAGDAFFSHVRTGWKSNSAQYHRMYRSSLRKRSIHTSAMRSAIRIRRLLTPPTSYTVLLKLFLLFSNSLVDPTPSTFLYAALVTAPLGCILPPALRPPQSGQSLLLLIPGTVGYG